jgi:hypothetical protein
LSVCRLSETVIMSFDTISANAFAYHALRCSKQAKNAPHRLGRR